MTHALHNIQERLLDHFIAEERCGRIPSLRAVRNALIVRRMEIRRYIHEYQKDVQEWRSFRREQRKLKEQGIVVTLLDAHIKRLKNRADIYHEMISSSGASVMALLDMWQHAGATLRDLCDLCGLSYAKIVEELKDEKEQRLSKLIFIHNLDYAPHDKTDWIDFDHDGPFTHAVKEYMLDIMTKTPGGRAAADEALRQTMPELWESALIVHTDEDGTKYLTDRDGNFMGTIEE